MLSKKLVVTEIKSKLVFTVNGEENILALPTLAIRGEIGQLKAKKKVRAHQIYRNALAMLNNKYEAPVIVKDIITECSTTSGVYQISLEEFLKHAKKGN